jgi:hypothetical protein
MDNIEDKLDLAYNKFVNDKHNFKPRMLVTWKEGLANRALPKTGGVGIVIRVIENAQSFQFENPGSPLFTEVLDIEVGILTEENDFLTFLYDSRRLEPVPSK